jgi:hypothetical protein
MYRAWHVADANHHVVDLPRLNAHGGYFTW